MDYVLLKLAHIALSAIWMGAGITFPLDIRATVARGPPHTEVLRERVARVTRVALEARQREESGAQPHASWSSTTSRTCARSCKGSWRGRATKRS